MAIKLKKSRFIIIKFECKILKYKFKSNKQALVVKSL
jgi:hypothetical protein